MPRSSENPAMKVFRGVMTQIHRILAMMVFVSGVWFIAPLIGSVLQGDHYTWAAQTSWRDALDLIGLTQLPRVVIALSLVLMSFGLLSRARLAWTFSLAMLVPAIAISLYTDAGRVSGDVVFNAALVLLLLFNGSAFARSSVTAGTLFALSSVISLLWYAVLGTLYLGHEFSPKVLSLPDAVYFGIVAMSTVGFGDIVPVTQTSRLFVVSVIMLGVTVFASAIGAVLVPVLSGTLREILQRKARLSMKKNHTILCGATPLARTVYDNLVSRGEQVTVVVRPDVEHDYPAGVDLIRGDASNDDVLRQAGVTHASYVLAMREDDPDNAFIVLAVKAISGCQAKTVAVVNHPQNLEKVRMVNPDMLLSPQLLGAELLSRIMRGETFDKDLISELFVAKPLAAVPPVADSATSAAVS